MKADYLMFRVGVVFYPFTLFPSDDLLF